MVVDPFMKSILRNIFSIDVNPLGLCRLWFIWIICHGSLLIRYKNFIHDKMIWVFVIHLIEYVIDTYIYMYVNRQRLALSHEQPPQPICLWVGIKHNILMLINEWKVYKRLWVSLWLGVKMRFIVNDILTECNRPQLHLPIWTRLEF